MHNVSDPTLFLAEIAKEWLTFERLRQELQNLNALDPVLVSARSRDVKETVLELLSPKRPTEEVERTRYALIRAMAGNRQIAERFILELANGQRGLPVNNEGVEPDVIAAYNGALQAMIGAPNDIFAGWESFIEHMQQVGGQLCHICIDTRFSGSGFLISDRHVLTAHHCVGELTRLISSPAAEESLCARLSVVFDDIVDPTRPPGPFRTVFKVAKKWLVCHSPQDDRENDAKRPLDRLTPNRLDFAVICLDQLVGRTAPKMRPSARRGWIDLGSLAARPPKATQMLIAHFPGGADLRLTVGIFDEHSDCDSRVRYRTPAIMGSSGAPCFTVDWKPYAIHNAGYKAALVNQGVPLTKIVACIGGLQKLLQPSADPDLLPAVTSTRDPILGRQDIARQVHEILQGQSDVVAMIVTSAPKGGKTFTADLVRSMVIDRQHAAFVLNAETFAADSPEAFANRLVHEIAVNTTTKQPASPDSRQRARWICQSLSDWTRTQLASVGQSSGDQVKWKTLWVILDGCDRVRFTQETHDLLVALIGSDTAKGETPVRFLLLGYEGDLSAVPAEKVSKFKLDLISAHGVLPFMRSVLDSVNVTESLETTQAGAKSWVTAAKNFGISSIPQVVKGLKGWEQQRQEHVAESDGDDS